MGYLFDRLGFHVFVADGCPGGGGAGRMLASHSGLIARCLRDAVGGHHGPAIQNDVGVVGGYMDIFTMV